MIIFLPGKRWWFQLSFLYRQFFGRGLVTRNFCHTRWTQIRRGHSCNWTGDILLIRNPTYNIIKRMYCRKVCKYFVLCYWCKKHSKFLFRRWLHYTNILMSAESHAARFLFFFLIQTIQCLCRSRFVNLAWDF